MIQWIDFATSTISGACAFIALFEGTRRWKRYGFHRAALAMTMFGGLFCAAYAAFPFWKHLVLEDMRQVLTKKMFTEELPADWGKHLDPDNREGSSLSMARMAFLESGALRGYFDKSGERKRFVPTEEDIKNRDFAVVTTARLEDAIQANRSDTVVWIIWGLIAVLFGLGVAHDKPPLPANNTVEPDARKGGARGSP